MVEFFQEEKRRLRPVTYCFCLRRNYKSTDMPTHRLYYRKCASNDEHTAHNSTLRAGKGKARNRNTILALHVLW